MTETHLNLGANRVYSVERALLLLQCFTVAGETRTLASLARQSGMYKSTILRLSASLCQMGFLRRQPDGAYSLGPELKRLGALAQAEVDVESIMRPALKKLANVTQETASFYIRDGRSRVCLFRENSPRTVRHHLEEGGRHPIAIGAAGKILRAFSKHVKDPELASVKRKGWASSLGERDPDLAAISVPVRNRDGDLLGALTVSAILTRFGHEHQLQAKTLLFELSTELSRKLEHVKPSDMK